MTGAERRRLLAVCAEIVGVEPEDLEPETDFFEDLNIDSDDLADLFVAIEDAFDIELDDSLLGAVRTFQNLEELIEDVIG